MTPDEQRLWRKLLAAVLLKLVVLFVLWWVFVRDARLSLDANRVAAQLSGQAIPQGASK